MLFFQSSSKTTILAVMRIRIRLLRDTRLAAHDMEDPSQEGRYRSLVLEASA